MLPTRQGSFRLFRFAGIDVFLHWSWFLVAFYEISNSQLRYSSAVWNLLEYLALFLIVLMHEFGHSLACRSVGGKADQIVLWPLGGVAYVAPPPRPGATLWSIAAGPLVNVVLFPILSVLNFWLAPRLAEAGVSLDVITLIRWVWVINFVLLVFNLLPVYPLDGGQILRSLLWFVVGPARSLMIAAIFGFVGVAGLAVLAFYTQSIWSGVICFFIFMNCLRGFAQAKVMARLAEAPKHEGYKCPACSAPPPIGNFWLCRQCRKPFDPFNTNGVCPHCGGQFPATTCPNCGSLRPIAEWSTGSPSTPPPLSRAHFIE